MTRIDLLLEEAIELTDLAARLRDRTADWREWNDELLGDNKEEIAEEEAAEAARQAWEAVEAAEALEGTEAA